MNRKEYRDALRGIRFSEEKRQEILAELRKPVPGSVDEILTPPPLRSTQQTANPPDKKTERKRIREEKRRKLEEETMKTEMKMIKYFWPVFTAATLAVAGVFYFTRRETPAVLAPVTTVTHDGYTLNLTDQLAPDYTLPFSNNQHPYNGSINVPWTIQNQDDIYKSDTGWYYRKVEEVSFYHKTYPLWYTDAETGESAVVCARPNCKHDGNEYCTATTGMYQTSEMIWYDGYLYTVTTRFPKKISDPYGGEEWDEDAQKNSKQVLLRYSPDGTEITELAEFGSGIGCSRPVIHRGYVWCVVSLQTHGEMTENPITHGQQAFVSGGWEIWGYELATGKTVKVLSGMGEPGVNHVNNSPILFAAGDCLYFERTNGDWSGGQGLTQFSLMTGETRVVTNALKPLRLISDHQIVCAYQKSATDNGIQYIYFLNDLDTGEEFVIPPTYGEPFAIDGEYLYCRRAVYDREKATENVDETFDLLIIDIGTMEVVQTVPMYSEQRVTEDEIGRRTDYYGCYLSGIYDKYVYRKTTESEYDYGNKVGFSQKSTITFEYCTVEELLNNPEPQWKIAFTTGEEAR